MSLILFYSVLCLQIACGSHHIAALAQCEESKIRRQQEAPYMDNDLKGHP